MRTLIFKLTIPNDDYDDVHPDIIIGDYISSKGLADASIEFIKEDDQELSK
jgi:hypothetical protein